MKLLVTFFGPFPGMPVNPSAGLVARFARRHEARLARLGIALVTAELPVVYGRVGIVLAHVTQATQPDAIIHVGVAGRRAKLSIETRALNRIGTLRTDASRSLNMMPTVTPGGAAQLRARWPAARLVAALNGVHVPTQPSIDAGDYVCNQSLYLTLLRTQVPAGFLHIPRPRGNGRAGRGSALRPSLDDMVRALAAAAVTMAVEVRRRA